MKNKKFKPIAITALTILVISISAYIAYNELTRPTSPIITIENNIVSWTATGAGDIEAGRFIRSYEVRVVIGSETFTTIVECPFEIGAIVTKDLTDFYLANKETTTANADVSVRTIRNLNAGTRFSNWSNIVTWVRT